MADCESCALIARRDAGEAPPWDRILRTPGWDVVHAFGTSVEGWIVFVLRRHVPALADLTKEEAAELGPLIVDVSKALREVVHCETTYVAQFAEHPQHRHVHVHVIPRYTDLSERHIGPRIFGLMGGSVPEERRNVIAGRMVRELADLGYPVSPASPV